MIVVDILLLFVAVALLLPAVVILLESIAALLSTPRVDTAATGRPRVAVVVPAHNEAAGIRATLMSLQPQLDSGDRLLVVADNCDDDTAAIARDCGAQVVERHEPDRHGKGYALDRAVRELAHDPPDVMVVIDADCRTDPGAIETIATTAAATGRPVQAAYVVAPPQPVAAPTALSAFAFTMKNRVRPRGLARLQLPCLLTGSGMALPWQAIRTAALASPHAVEDMQLSVDLALAGYLPLHCADARVTGRLHTEKRAALEQHRRWEHGHIDVLRSGVPRLLLAAWGKREPRLLALALELSVPPLSLLLLSWLVAIAAALGARAFGASHLPAALLAVAGVLMITAVTVAWMRFGREIAPASLLWTIPRYVAAKVPLYAALLTRHRRRVWNPQRSPTAPGVPPVVQLGDAALDAITEVQCVDRVMSALAHGRGGWIATLNLDQLRLVARSPEYAKLCAAATLRVADGMPLVWASRLQRTPLPERVAGSNLIWSISAAAAERGYSIFLLGGATGTAATAAEVLQRRLPALTLAGTSSPAIDLAERPADLAVVVETVVQARPDIVYVALGKPKQEQVIAQLGPHLPQAWFVPVGISFSFVSGTVRRAPPWMQRLGLEWAHRLAQEPQRLARRYLIEDAPFALALLARSARLGVRRQRNDDGAS